MSDSESFFWSVELTKGNPEATWPADTPSNEAEEAANYVLEVERACLGGSAKQNDLNIVSVSTVSNEGETSSVTPVCRLKVGGKEQCRIGLQFTSHVTFKLTSGNGPIHLMGLSETVYDDEDDIRDAERAYDDDSAEDDSEEGDSEEDDAPLPAFAAKKRSAPGSGNPPAKKQVRGISQPMDDDDEDDSEDDSEEESDDELNLMAKKGIKLAANIDDDDDDDSDDDDEDYDEDDDDDEDDEDDDDDDDEDDDDEDDDSDMDVAPQLVPAKGKPQGGKGQQQQQQKGGKPGQQQQQKGGKPAQQQQKQQQQQPKQQSKAQQTPQKSKEQPSAEAVLKKLMESPNLPKKQEKFTNLVKNAHKITDQKVIDDLWQKVQKSKK